MFDNKLGYTKSNNYDYNSLYSNISNNIDLILKYITKDKIQNILNIGCGKGYETIVINEILAKNTVGIDLETDNTINKNHNTVTLISNDFCSYDFYNEQYDLIYSYHMLEHVSSPEEMIKKIKGLVSKDGVVFIGFPNKRRLFGYINTSEKISVFYKIKWNLRDYYYKIIGRFENKFGAHAGFTHNEFCDIVKEQFSIIDITEKYYDKKYNKYLLYNILKKLHIVKYLYPCLYYILK